MAHIAHTKGVQVDPEQAVHTYGQTGTRTHYAVYDTGHHNPQFVTVEITYKISEWQIHTQEHSWYRTTTILRSFVGVSADSTVAAGTAARTHCLGCCCCSQPYTQQPQIFAAAIKGCAYTEARATPRLSFIQ